MPSLGEEVDRLSEEARAQAARLGGGWRLEQGIMPVVVLTTVEAQRLIKKMDELERLRRTVQMFIADTKKDL